ncbi:FAD-dependent oxidoreductase [Chloroflexota bacterium]
MTLENVIETDVLIIGGGIAGCFAAIKAKEQGQEVILVDKGYVSKSGETPYAGDIMVFNPEWGHNLDEWMTQVSTVGEYVNNRHWNEMVFRESYARYLDLESWGVQFLKENDVPQRLSHPLKNADLPDRDKFPPLVSEVVHWLPGFPEIIRKQVVKSGVKIMDRFMVTDLVQQDGRVVGAIGITIEENDVYIIKAKATVISAGGGGFRPMGYPTHELTADGHVMAYRAGAEIIGKEFLSPHSPSPEHPGWPPMYLIFSSGHSAALPGGWIDRKLVNAEGDEVPSRGMAWHGWIDAEYEAHAGRAPLFKEDTRGNRLAVGGPGAHGSMLGHATGGIYPVNDNCAANIDGLFAAGDSLGTSFVGASYSGFGFATMYASVSGTRAGLGAAEYALQAAKLEVDDELLAGLKKRLIAPLERKGGFSPRWVTQILQNTLLPYFVLYIKKEDRMRTALSTVEFLRDHIVPKMYARDDHELRLVHETNNMVTNAEMKLRASLFRTESRGNHYREDYPKRDDPSWLAWVMLKEENGEMKTFKELLPEEWHPDMSKTYEERYPMRFPEE